MTTATPTEPRPIVLAFEDGYLEAVVTGSRLDVHRSWFVKDHDQMMKPVIRFIEELGLTKVEETDLYDDGVTVGLSRDEVYA